MNTNAPQLRNTFAADWRTVRGVRKLVVVGFVVILASELIPWKFLPSLQTTFGMNPRIVYSNRTTIAISYHNLIIYVKIVTATEYQSGYSKTVYCERSLLLVLLLSESAKFFALGSTLFSRIVFAKR